MSKDIDRLIQVVHEATLSRRHTTQLLDALEELQLDRNLVHELTTAAKLALPEGETIIDSYWSTETTRTDTRKRTRSEAEEAAGDNPVELRVIILRPDGTKLDKPILSYRLPEVWAPHVYPDTYSTTMRAAASSPSNKSGAFSSRLDAHVDRA
jgi:hypothetical protein